jgi:hypothetical protein
MVESIYVGDQDDANRKKNGEENEAGAGYQRVAALQSIFFFDVT